MEGIFTLNPLSLEDYTCGTEVRPCYINPLGPQAVTRLWGGGAPQKGSKMPVSLHEMKEAKGETWTDAG